MVEMASFDRVVAIAFATLGVGFKLLVEWRTLNYLW
jgi:hypothetical protein